MDILQNIGQNYVDDSTNTNEEYSRNYIRHRILPEMEHVNQKAVAHISELGMQMQELLAYVTPQMEKLYNENVITNEQGELFLAEKTFSVMSLFEQKEMMRRMLFEISGHRKDISLVHVEQMLALMANKEGKQQNCPYGVLAKRVRDGLLLMKLSADVTFSDKNKQKDGQQKSDEQNLENLNRKNKKCGNHSEDKMQPVYLPLTAESEEAKAEDPFITSVIKIVEENICEADFSVKKLASELNMSQPTLYRKVKQSTDYTIIELIRGVRMRRAGVLLKTKQYGVQEVAEMVGYNDIPTFRKHFVDAFGTTPSTYE